MLAGHAQPAQYAAAAAAAVVSADADAAVCVATPHDSMRSLALSVSFSPQSCAVRRLCSL